jgi:hypothetical protein
MTSFFQNISDVKREQKRRVTLQPHQISINSIAQVAPAYIPCSLLGAEHKVDLANFPRHSLTELEERHKFRRNHITAFPVLWCDAMIGIKRAWKWRVDRKILACAAADP